MSRFWPDEKLKTRLKELLRNVVSVHGQVAEPMYPHELPREYLELMEAAARNADYVLGMLCADVGLSVGNGGSIAQDLAVKGLVVIHSVSKGHGGNVKCLEITRDGNRELKKAGRRVQERLMRGDYLHDLKARWVKRSVEAEGHEVATEKRVGDNNDVDFLCRNKEGRLYVIEVCQSGTPKRHIRMAEKASNMNGIGVVFLVGDTELVKKLKNILAKELDYYSDKIIPINISEFYPFNRSPKVKETKTTKKKAKKSKK